jgi:hypothetical protein
VQFGFALCATIRGGPPFIVPGGPLHTRLVAEVEATQAALDRSAN